MTRDFYQRFDITTNMDEAKRKFVNRALNVLFSEILYSNSIPSDDRYHIANRVASALGMRYSYNDSIDGYINNDFYNCMQAIEAFYNYVSRTRQYVGESINAAIMTILLQSELELGIKWENGKFIKTGAKLLDDELINDSLRWLRNPNYQTVLTPFEKGLGHYLESEKNPELLSDVVTDMYEALESLAKIITENDKDLSANRELFIKKINASEEYKKLLKDYVEYANIFRHGLKEAAQKPALSAKEVESFLYMTGIFIRLAMEEK
jgi:hypothetical protein